MSNNLDVTVIVPLYDEEESLPELMKWIASVMKKSKYNYEVLMVDDGSNDKSWEVINELKNQYGDALRAFRYRRNYGKSAALYTGFQNARGDVVVTMDADMQDSPEEIPDMYNLITKHGFDMISGWKKKRYDPISKTIPSKFYNWVARKATGIKLHDFNCGLKAYRNKVVKSIEVYGEMHRYIPVLVKQAGFNKIGEKVVKHQKRQYGKTKFGFERFINGFLDLMSVLFITRFAKRPMHLFGVLGCIVFLVGLASALYLGIRKIVAISHGLVLERVTENPYFYIALTCMVIGVVLFLAGFLAELISRSSTDRNNYQIDEIIE
ncbi:MAG: glycosyltransferase family 2 protein [Candidatus Delongbacteria bacterium]|jgi:glycosyltransferase involved in cell wall biosynthesis|nr:glycosyltransferase family 2 protein [Candidatus Delongbacteria bacterium]